MADRTLTENECQTVFQALVEAQDGGMDAAASRRTIAEQFSISEGQVRLIERQGIDAGWPPLA